MPYYVGDRCGVSPQAGAHGRTQQVAVRHVASHGKGSHGTLYYGNRLTTVKDLKKEIKEGLLVEMCRQLGIKKTSL